MKLPVRTSLAIACLIPTLLCGCRSGRPDTVTQVSTFDALLAGVYDGHMKCRDLLRHGDLGIGTFEGLDGEMVMLDRRMYQVRADGKVYIPSGDIRTPLAVVAQFNPDLRIAVTQRTDFAAFEHIIASAAPNSNLFYAVKATGRFTTMRTRSVPAQNKPYPPLADVTRNQPVFELGQTSGTIVGFISPAFAKGIGVPGCHVHFLADDLRAGGHVLGFVMESGEIAVDSCSIFTVMLPAESGAFGRTDLSTDRSVQTRQVEK